MTSSPQKPPLDSSPESYSEGRDAVLPGEPMPGAGSGCWEQTGRWNAAAGPATERGVLEGERHRISLPSYRDSFGARSSEDGHWYSGHFTDDERDTDIARATDFGEPPPEPSLADRAVLLRLEGVEAGRVYSLGRGEASLGRHPDNELVIDDGGISRRHARITWELGGHVVEDQGSRNGTFVQGERTYGRRRLEDGDVVQLGPKVGLRYSLVDDRQETLLKRLYDSSNRDALTGAYNRKHYTDRLTSEIAYAERHSTHVSLIMIDIDHFKKVNDTYGHAAGDTLLKQVSSTILRQLRTEDVFARVGGEEFVVILRGIPLVGAARLAERLRATIAALPTMFGGRIIPVTISLGCAALSELKSADPANLAILADRRLYAAKASGRNRVVAKDSA